MLHHFLMSLLTMLAIQTVVMVVLTIAMMLDGTVSAMQRAITLEREASEREGRPFSDARMDKLTDQLVKDLKARRSSKAQATSPSVQPVDLPNHPAPLPLSLVRGWTPPV